MASYMERTAWDWKLGTHVHYVLKKLPLRSQITFSTFELSVNKVTQDLSLTNTVLPDHFVDVSLHQMLNSFSSYFHPELQIHDEDLNKPLQDDWDQIV